MLFFVLFLVTTLLTENEAEPPVPKKNIPKVYKRIIGGMSARPNELPYQLAFEWIGNGIVCGAALVHPQYALSAAHCTASIPARFIRIIAGEHLLDRNEGHEQKRKVVEIIQHEKYNEDTVDPGAPSAANDITLLKLETPFILDQYVQVIPMADSNYKARGNVLVSGWGDLRNKAARGSNRLQKVQLPLVNLTDCQKAYDGFEPFVITEKQLCAGFLGIGGKDSCQGDSGGPLVVEQGRGKFLLVGIVSSGYECGLPEYPGVFTSVAAYRTWIDSHINA